MRSAATILLLVVFFHNSLSDGLFKENVRSGFETSSMWNQREVISPVLTYTGSSTFLSGVVQTSSSIPKGYYLGQNFPNPFNPETNIYFSIRENSIVKLIVSDITGRELTTLVDETLTAGVYKVGFNGNNISSGTYFYKLTALATDNSGGSFLGVKRMVLIK